MVKRLFIATIVAISPLYALAQGLITGSIKDARSGEALIGASVIVKSEKGQGVVTDVDGKFALQTKKEAPLTLRVEYVGYLRWMWTCTTSRSPWRLRSSITRAGWTRWLL